MSKVTGEEKHYQKLNKRLQQELNQVRITRDSQLNINQTLREELRTSNEYNNKLIDENVELRKLTGLSEEEITKLLKATKGADAFIGMMKMSGMLGNY